MQPTSPPHPAQTTPRYGPFTPLFWHGLRLGDCLALLARNRFRMGPDGLLRAAGIIPSAALNSFWAALQSLVHRRRIERLQLAHPPLFILGHWRAGTTLLHELLIRDPIHTYPNTYQCFAPHHFLLTESWFAPLTRWMLPAKRPMDEMPAGWDRPQEDEFALMNMGLPSPYLCWAFPDHGPVHPEYLTLDGLANDDLNHWRETFEFFIKSIAYKKNVRVILKSPPHTARVRTLLEVFPDARFVHIVRDPLVLYPSTLHLWKTLCDTQGLQKQRDSYPWIQEQVLENLVRMYDAFERDRPLIPPGHLIDVRYEHLIADPIGQMRSIYDRLDLGDFARLEPRLAEYLPAHKAYRPNRYTLTPQEQTKVRQRWAMYFERYGYT